MQEKKEYKDVAHVLILVAFLAAAFILCGIPKAYASSDRYWVGGTGNWSDASHWSTSSGGSGGASVPDSSTNCYFDSSSFSGSGQTVTLDEDASCDSMDWTRSANDPTFALNGHQLSIAQTLMFGAVDHPMNITGNISTIPQISTDYVTVTNSTCSGTTPCYAGTHSTDGGGNSGWFFTSPNDPQLTSVTGVTGLNGANWVVVSSSLAYVGNFRDGTLSIIDVSNPASPALLSTLSLGSTSKITALALSGHYAYLSDWGARALDVVDIASPSDPILVATTTQSQGQSTSGDMTISGHYIYLTDQGVTGGFMVFDIATATDPTEVGVYSLPTSTDVVGGSANIAVSGNYAYETAPGIDNYFGDNLYASSSLTIVDISDPTNPTTVSTIKIPGMGGNNGSEPIAVGGHYAYIGNNQDDTFDIVDISNPDSPSIVSTIPITDSDALNPAGVFLSGHFAYVSEYDTEQVAAIDVENPAAPVVTGLITTAFSGNGGGSPNHVVFSNNYLYTANYDGDSMSVINIAYPSVPDPPTSAMATTTGVGGGEVSLAWAAPGSDGGDPITDYLVQYKLSASSTFGNVFDTGSTNTSTTVTDLTSGLSYDFEILAENEVGTSTPSNVVSATPTSTVPDPPTSVSATAGNQNAIVSFSAPANDGASDITGYTAASDPGDIIAHGDAAGDPITISGLTVGVSYTFTVVATNAIGNSSPSSPSNSVTPILEYNASAVLGQSDFVSSMANGSSGITNAESFSEPIDVALDAINHRLFVADTNNARILVFNLDVHEDIASTSAAYVIGQQDFVSSSCNNGGISSSTLCSPEGIAYDAYDSRLFVSDIADNRVLIFDVATSTIQNGEGAMAVLGEPDLVSSESGTSSSTLSHPQGLAYDASNNRLFVGDAGNSRVLIFDVATSTIQNGEGAIAVLGQPDFVSSSCNNGGISSSSLCTNDPQLPLAYDPQNERLFVGDSEDNSRILMFDVNPLDLTNGEGALAVLGKLNFTSQAEGISATAIRDVYGLSYDPDTSRLFAADTNNARILVFDVSTSTISLTPDGESAENVLGQPDFASENAVTSQSGFSGPQGIVYDPASGNLFVVDTNNERILQFEFTNVYSSTTLSQGTVGSFYSDPVTTTGYNLVSGSLPSGLALYATQGTSTVSLLGSPAAAGTYVFDTRTPGNLFQGVLINESTNTLVVAPAPAPASVSSGGGGGGGGSYYLSSFGTVTILAPLSGTFLSGVATVTAELPPGTAFAYFVIDGIKATTIATSSFSTTMLDTQMLSDGLHSLVIVAQDAHGDTAQSQSVTFQVANGSSPATSASSSSLAHELASLESELLSLEAQAAGGRSSSSISLIPSVSGNTTGSFLNNLRLGDYSSDVLRLQEYLNQNGFILNTRAGGPGSRGHETEKFGYATQYELKRFQETHGIPATGYFGPLTRAYVNGHQ